MQDRPVITFNFEENFIQNLADYLIQKNKNNYNLVNFSKTVCVFGGKRPFLFLNRVLSIKLKSCFMPPKFFSIDEFIDYIIQKKGFFSNIGELDASFIIYRLVKDNIPQIIEGRQNFSQFLPWAKELISFIEQLDLEDIEDKKLEVVEKSASIGYDVSDNINLLLKNIINLRDAYHKELKKRNIYSRGMRYLEASKIIDEVSFDEFDEILFCNFFYLHKTEQKIIKSLLDRKKAICFFEGSQDEWSVLEKNSKIFGFEIRPEKKEVKKNNLSIYKGFDLHSQVCLARDILSKIDKNQDTVIVLPQQEAVVVLLCEISSVVNEFNISLGYPLKRNTLYQLFMHLSEVQSSRRENFYYTKDYLNLLRHPIVKNLNLNNESSVTRILVHTIEDYLQGKKESFISGSLFLKLKDIEKEDNIFLDTIETLRSIEISCSFDECKSILKKLHQIFFTMWEDINNFYQFADNLKRLLDILINKSLITNFSYNVKVIEKIFAIISELENLSFNKEPFRDDEIWEVFRQKLETEIISFSGSPLRGLQVLGLFETRSLNFKNVIVMDVNESILPKIKIYEPLIPREIMLNLGLNRLEKEDEIQRYQFMRLVRSAQNVYLIYQENQEKEKSRFIEELIWQRQKEEKRLEVFSIPKATFSISVLSKESCIPKTQEMLEFLKKEVYSASRLNTYLECPLRFYFKYVLGLDETQNLLQEPEAQTIGTFIHQFLEAIFKGFVGKKPIIDENFKKFFMKELDKHFEQKLKKRMRSDAFLLENIIKNRLSEFLEKEKKRKVLKIICLEETYQNTITVDGQTITFNYIVDRIDQLENKSILIIDYKTGNIDLVSKKLKFLKDMKLERRQIKENIRSFQLPLYYYFISKKFSDTSVNAAFYSLRTLEQKLFIEDKDYQNREEFINICMESLKYILKEIFDPNIPFVSDRQEKTCKTCSFKFLCH
ncbi:MAG: PD-(D/E)XK nuclease family protein [Candidatus Omnitrophica bacterium]|nr:PD-(D/E)XK nuclease family protein [Candidatus Omnitrophota bacterium]